MKQIVFLLWRVALQKGNYGKFLFIGVNLVILPPIYFITIKMKNKVLQEGLAFDDVLVVPAYSEILPKEVSTKTRFSKNINLNIPIVSSAMDTVSESAMAIAIAREGGIAVLHKNMSIENQVKEVNIVKRAESGVILNPITIQEDSIVGDAKKICFVALSFL